MSQPILPGGIVNLAIEGSLETIKACGAVLAGGARMVADATDRAVEYTAPSEALSLASLFSGGNQLSEAVAVEAPAHAHVQQVGFEVAEAQEAQLGTMSIAAVFGERPTRDAGIGMNA